MKNTKWSCPRLLIVFGFLFSLALPMNLRAELPLVKVEFQPFVQAVKRLITALDMAGAPLDKKDLSQLEKLLAGKGEDHAHEKIQKILDKHCLIGVHINPESRVKVQEGPCKKELMQQGWRTFLIKVHNEAGVTAPLKASSPNAKPLYKRSTGSPDPKRTIPEGEVIHRFLDIHSIVRSPLKKTLSGLEAEYRILQLYCRDAGKREAKLAFDVGQGTQDLGFRNEVSILFNSKRAVEVVLEVKDFNGRDVMASFIIRDERNRLYPSPSRRLAPDFFFHPQVYRETGESIFLPPGKYSVEYGRGPEYLTKHTTIEIPDTVSHKVRFNLERWIQTSKEGWWSGDHHIHAAGCAHYESPMEGVLPQDMMRHCLGEDLNVGCVLSWGPCWYFQKQFFEGKVNAFSKDEYLMRYDVEVSGFPSSHAGHLSLLRLVEDDYPGTTKIHEWPSWDLPILQWAQKQGGIAGFSHSGWGLQIPGDHLPNYNMPPFDGIGANEYIVDVVHGAVDFISTVDTPIIWELNIWYHTLNCGYRARISGETDFPCIYGEKVGLGRSYVKMTRTPGKPLNFDTWALGVKDGRNYVSDGKSHLMDFTVGGVKMGEPGSQGKISELQLNGKQSVKMKARVASRLNEKPNPSIKNRPLSHKPYWDVERARIGKTRQVPVEVVVNGKSVATKNILADGTIRDIEFDIPIKHSSWVALRIFPSAHTNPVFIHVDGKPIRASKKSAEWCLKAVDVCWNQKQGRIRDSEKPAAIKAYDVARQAYRQAVRDSVED